MAEIDLIRWFLPTSQSTGVYILVGDSEKYRGRYNIKPQGPVTKLKPIDTGIVNHTQSQVSVVSDLLTYSLTYNPGSTPFEIHHRLGTVFFDVAGKGRGPPGSREGEEAHGVG